METVKSVIDWKKYFDAIYCIHFLPKRDERFQRINGELSRVGILNSGVFKWKFTADLPYYSELHRHSKFRHDVMRQKQGMFNCVIAHYEIYKEALLLGHNRILIIEEDAVFLKDLSVIADILSDMPNTDVVLLDKFVYNPYEYARDLDDRNLINKHFCRFDSKSTKYGSAACYCVSRAAMDAIVRLHEKIWYNPDEVWNDWGDNGECNALTKSFAILNVCYQKSFAKSNNDNIELAYEFIGLDKSLYG